MRFTVNETPAGIQTPSKTICKVEGCTRQRRQSKKGKRQFAFCKVHGGLRHQMAKKKYKDFIGNNELVIP